MNSYKSAIRLWLLLNNDQFPKTAALSLVILFVAVFDSLSIFLTFIFIDYILSGALHSELVFSIGDRQFRIEQNMVYVSFLLITLAPLVRYFAQAHIINYGNYLANRLSVRLYQRYICAEHASTQDFTVSDLNAAILSKTNMVTHSAIMPIIQLIGNIIAVAGILVSLVFIDPKITLTASLSLVFIYVSIYFSKVKSMREASSVINESLDTCSLYIREGLSSKRYVLNNFLQSKYVNNFYTEDRKMRIKLAKLAKTAIFPRYALESVVLLGLMSFALISSDKVVSFVPIIGTFAMAGQRLLPLCQQIFASTTSLNGATAAIESLLADLDTEYKHNAPIHDSSIKSGLPLKLEICNLTVGHGSLRLADVPSIEINAGDVVVITVLFVKLSPRLSTTPQHQH